MANLDSWLRSSVSGSAVVGQFQESYEIVDSYTIDPKNLPKDSVLGESVKNDSGKDNRKSVSQGQPMKNSKSSQVDLGLTQVGKRGRALKGQLADAALSSLMFE